MPLSLISSASRPERFSLQVILLVGLVFAFTETSLGLEPVDFARDVRPALARACFQCHGPDPATRKADLRLDLREGLMSVVEAGDLDESELWLRILHDDPTEVMPPPSQAQQLERGQVEQIRQWIEAGAKWSEHWAFEPPVRPELPAVETTDWPSGAIDHFVLARLEIEGLIPSPLAQKEKLLRRLSFDITGLPPTVEELESFLADDRPEAYEEWVDRYLASSRYGENMAVRWLDGARFADSNGYQNDFGRSMWPWRDWVIRSYNENLPYDQFVTEQIAGDLLPAATDAQRLATGFQRNHRTVTEAGSIEEEWRVENVVDRVDTTATVFMGLTYACARCHDHKYDPISQAEYYSLFAYFNNTVERGFYNETRGNVPTLLRVPTDENLRQLAEFDRGIQSLDAQIEAENPEEREAKFSQWLEELRHGSPEIPAPILEVPLDRSLDATVAPTDTVVQYTGEKPEWVEGLFGGAIRLDAKPTTRVDLGSATDFEEHDSFSYSVWVKQGNGGAIFSKMDVATAYRGIDLILIGGRPTVHLIHDWPRNAIKVEADVELPSDVWTHLLFTYDGSRKASGLHIYVNGEAPPRKIHVDTLKGTIRTHEPLRIGGRSTREYYRGIVRDFRAYDRVLSPLEARAIARERLVAVSGTGDSPTGNGISELHPELVAFHRAHYLEGAGSLHGQRAQVKRERQRYWEKQVPSAMILEERKDRRPTFVLDRGLYDAPDPSRPVDPGVPAFLPPLPKDAPLDRRALAAWLVDPDHPLTARVAVNHLWQHLFGVGLVETPDNFGLRGGQPSHPHLLDWLATEFVRSGWDTKALLKKIVLSSTYRQSSIAGSELRDRDPHNRLLARGPRVRLGAEMIRDQALAVSGLLVEKVGGPSVRPYQPAGLWQELAGGASQGSYRQGKGADLYRRSLYTNRKRTVPHPTLSVFDAPSFEVCQMKRASTNTPLQALALLNDVTYVEAASHLAGRMISHADPPADRLRYGFRSVTSRAPQPKELAVLERGLEHHLAQYRNDPEAAKALLSHGESRVGGDFDPAELAAYAAIAGVLLNLDETVMKE